MLLPPRDQLGHSAVSLASKLRGLVIPFPTPFDNSGLVDTPALRENLLKWNAAGISGYVALGSTGERPHLTGSERLEVLKTVQSTIPSELLLIAGVGEQSTRATLEELQQVSELGAEVALVLPPHYYRSQMTQTVLQRHFEELAARSALPLILYNVPQFTGVWLEPDTIRQLSLNEMIVGIKDSSGDVAFLKEVLKIASPQFSVLVGNGSLLCELMREGAHGAILAVGCVAAQHCLSIMQAVKDGKYELGSALQEPLALLARAVTTKYGIAGLKAALDTAGFKGGRVRAPLQDASEGACKELEQLLQHCRERFVETLGDLKGVQVS